MTTYFDHAATTPLDERVLAAMMPYLTSEFGNASELHGLGRRARRAVDDARRALASALGCHDREIVFTAGGSEADALAISGVTAELAPGHVIVSAIEHPAVLRAARALRRGGWRVSELPVDEYGRVDVDAYRAAFAADTRLVSIHLANNVVGTLQPIRALAAIAHEHGVLFHSDAVQAVGAIAVNVNDLGVDLLSLSGHKLYGPKGSGALYVRRGVALTPLVAGGGQEDGRRSGTENVAGIVGLAAAVELALAQLDEVRPRLTGWRDRLIAELLDRVPESRLLGHRQERLPGHIALALAGLEGEALLLRLDEAGFAVASGSACAAGKAAPSPVATAMGVPDEFARGMVRITLGRENTAAEVERFVPVFVAEVEKLRARNGWRPGETGARSPQVANSSRAAAGAQAAVQRSTASAAATSATAAAALAGGCLVALSGGVDSSVAALLLKQSRVRLAAAMLTLWPAAHEGACCSAAAAERAAAAAALLDMPFAVVDAEAMFAAGVVEPFVASYLGGETPNPCVNCNPQRLALLVDLAQRQGLEHVATGHYARIVWRHGEPFLARARDRHKDQTYMLWAVAPQVLARLAFPLAELTKPEVREAARAAGLAAAAAAESQEICFAPAGYREFLSRRLPAREGMLTDESGAVVGQHSGHWQFTIGQRRGIGLSAAAPNYVLRRRAATNEVVIGPRAALETTVVHLRAVVDRDLGDGSGLTVQLRSKSPAVAAAALESAPGGLTVRLAQPFAGLAPGQSAVFYRDDIVVGGGIMSDPESRSGAV